MLAVSLKKTEMATGQQAPWTVEYESELKSKAASNPLKSRPCLPEPTVRRRAMALF
jgi:hypothetical protein